MKSLTLNSDDIEMYGTVDELLTLIKNLKQEIFVLRSQTTSSAVSSEERICVQQLLILEDKSSVCELDFEEAKKFEIFHKNLRLARGQVIDVTDKKKANQKLGTAELLKIAGV